MGRGGSTTARRTRRREMPTPTNVAPSARTSTIKTIATAYELPKSPKVEDVFSRAFLPPKAERTIQAATN